MLHLKATPDGSTTMYERCQPIDPGGWLTDVISTGSTKGKEAQTYKCLWQGCFRHLYRGKETPNKLASEHVAQYLDCLCCRSQGGRCHTCVECLNCSHCLIFLRSYVVEQQQYDGPPEISSPL